MDNTWQGWELISQDTTVVLSHIVDIVDSDIFGLHPNGISQEPPTDKLIDFEEYEGGCRRGQKVNKISGNAQQQGRGQ